MQIKLIKTTDYLLLIDEEAEIKEGTKWVYDNDKPSIIPLLGNTNIVKEGISKGWFNKIIAYYPLTKEAKELDLPLLPNPFKEVDIEKLANDKYPVSPQKRKIFIEGYEAVQFKQFSLEDMILFAEYVGNYYADIHKPVIPTEELLNNFIQSLSTQQLPKEFIPEYERDCPYDFTSRCTMDRCDCKIQIKTITNSEGKQEMAGVYKY